MTRIAALVVASFVLVLSACGGSEGGDGDSSESSADSSPEHIGIGDEYEAENGLVVIVGEPEEWTIEEARAHEGMQGDSDGECYVDPNAEGDAAYEMHPCEWDDWADGREGSDKSLPIRMKVPVTIRNDADHPIDGDDGTTENFFAMRDADTFRAVAFYSYAFGDVEFGNLLPGDVAEDYVYFFLDEYDADSVLVQVDFMEDAYYVTNNPSLLEG